jgi:hypothetical protein
LKAAKHANISQEQTAKIDPPEDAGLWSSQEQEGSAAVEVG